MLAHHLGIERGRKNIEDIKVRLKLLQMNISWNAGLLLHVVMQNINRVGIVRRIKGLSNGFTSFWTIGLIFKIESVIVSERHDSGRETAMINFIVRL